MTKSDAEQLADLLPDIEALRTSMERIAAGTTEDYAKWMAFKHCAQVHRELAHRYGSLTGEKVSFFDTERMKGSTDTIWPVQKEIFDAVFTEVCTLQARLSKRLPSGQPTGFDDLLHPVIRAAAIKHYQNGDYRNAVLDAVIALFDLLRKKSRLDLDGDNLCNQAFSPSRPILILSELETDSGQNDQRGFMDIFKGFYRGVRNPKAHSLIHDLDATKAGQHLVLASLLARRVDDAKLAPAREEASPA